MNTTPARIPSTEEVRRSRITHFQDWLRQRHGIEFSDYDSLWTWSVTEQDAFWDAIREYFAISLHGSWPKVLAERSMPGAVWYPGARLNYVEQVFRHSNAQRPAIVFGREDGLIREVGWAELERDVGALAQWFREHGVTAGDRVVAYLPNVPETIVAFLAVASIGAVWSVCSPDMGAASVLDRFRQVEPRVLLAVDGYMYAGCRFDRFGEVARLLREMPSLQHVVLLSGDDGVPAVDAGAVGITSWASAIARPAPLEPVHVPFDHPLWIVYSSGTTGLPKAIVHGHGGIVLEHVKTAALHFDLGSGDRFFWYSITGWVMWNLQVAGLLVGATVCIFDGSPGGPDASASDLGTLWRYASCARATFFGSGAAYFASCQKSRIRLTSSIDLSRLRTIGSTGSPLAAETEQWLYDTISPRVWIAPVSGGTDFASGFVGGVPTLPSYLGEMQVRCLGASVEAWNEAGEPLLDEVGELVCTAPMPSMPLRFWNDPDNTRYLESYFDTFPGVWRHGDWIRLVRHPGACGAVVYGRSDATINRHGIRMGTAELYRAVEALPEVLDSLVIDLQYLGRDPYMALFVVLQKETALDDVLKERIKGAIRSQISPRHVPTEIISVPDIPRTLTGKKLELPIKKLMLGQPVDKVLTRGALANPLSVEWFVEFARHHAP